MNTGQKTLEWLYREQLKVDDDWAVHTPRGFTWWADRHAQTIEVVREEKGPDGAFGYLISVRTDLLRGVRADEQTLKVVGGLLMPFASMAGPVIDANRQTLSLCSLVRVYESIASWMNPLISVAATLQIGEARILAPALAEATKAEEAISGHPQNGKRPQPDEMAELISEVFAPMGQQRSRWQPAEFESAVERCMRRPPAVMATAGRSAFTVEFPFGDQTSLCRATADEPHPRYGNGLLLLQSFPFAAKSEVEGIQVALSMNEAELTQRPFGYGFGSYVYQDGMLHFTTFFPNALYRPGLLPNIYFSCAGRARELSVRLAGRDWTADSFAPRRSALGRLIDLLRGG